MSFSGIGNLKTYAAETHQAETEENGTNVTANQINLNQVCDGSLSTASDVDWYKFTTTKRGYFQITLAKADTADASSLGYGWKMTVYPANANEDTTYGSDKITNSFTTAKAPWEAGTYYIRVEATYTGSAPTDQPYELTVNFTEDSNWEVEGIKQNNGVNSTATAISVNKEVKADLYYASDVDWYKYSVSAAGLQSIALRIDDTAVVDSIGKGWHIALYDSNYTFVREWDGITSTSETVKLPLHSGTYYIRVSATYTGSAPVKQIYNLKVNYTPTTTWETEWNSESSKANTISLNKGYKGVLYYSSDVDWYRFTTTKAGRVNLDFKADSSVNIESLGRGWKVSVYKVTDYNTAIKTQDWINTISNVRFTMDLPKGSYFVKVEATWSGSAPTNQTYTLKASFGSKPSTVSLTSAKAGAKSATLRWKKTANANGYIIYRSTSKNGKYAKVATIKKNSTLTYKNTGLKKGKTYYYYVVSYKTENGVTAYGNRSKVLAIKAK